MQEGDDITSPPRCFEEELRTWRRGVIHRRTADKLSSSPCTPSGKRLQASSSKLACPRSSELEVRSPDQVEVRILPVTFDGDTMSRQLMRRNRSFTATYATHWLDSRRARLCSSSPLVLSPFLYAMERKGGSMVDRPKKKLQRSQDFDRCFRSLEKLEMIPFFPRPHPFYRQMSGFIAINASFGNTWVSQKSTHDPRR